MKSTLSRNHREVPVVDPEEHWKDLHQPGDSRPGELLRQAGRKLRAMPLAEVAGIAAAGFALGYLIFSRSGRRHSSVGKLLGLGGAAFPAATKGLNRAYDSLRNGKSFERMGREMAKLRSHW